VLGDRAAGFLDSFAGDDDAPVYNSGQPPADGQQYFQLVYAVTGDQRETVLQAMRKARDDDGCATSIDALLLIATRYLEAS